MRYVWDASTDSAESRFHELLTIAELEIDFLMLAAVSHSGQTFFISERYVSNVLCWWHSSTVRYPEKLISLLKDQYSTQYRRQWISMDIKDVTKIEPDIGRYAMLAEQIKKDLQKYRMILK